MHRLPTGIVITAIEVGETYQIEHFGRSCYVGKIIERYTPPAKADKHWHGYIARVIEPIYGSAFKNEVKTFGYDLSIQKREADFVVFFHEEIGSFPLYWHIDDYEDIVNTIGYLKKSYRGGNTNP